MAPTHRGPVADEAPPAPASPSPARPSARWSADRTTVLIGAAGLVGLVLRLAWVLWVGDRPPQSLLIDPGRYLAYAENLADGHGYVEVFTGEPTAYYPPGYPLFLGGLRVVHDALPGDGSFPFFVACVQAVIGALLVPLAGSVARRVVGPTAGVVAAVLVAIYPNLVFHTGVVLGETLYNTLFMAFLALAVRRPWPEAVTPRAAAVATVPLALAIMVRPISLVVVPALVLCWWLAARDLKVVIRATVGLALVLALVMVPWTVRNQLRLDAFVPVSTNTGDNLCIGHNDLADGGFIICAGEDGPHRGTASEVRNDDEKTRRALEWIRDHPGREPGLVWKRFRVIYVDHGDHDALRAVQSYPTDVIIGTKAWMDPATERRLGLGADVAYVLVAVAGVVGLVRLVRRGPQGILVVLAAIGTAAVPLAFFGDPRFKVPVVPLLCIAAAAAVTWPLARPPTEASVAAEEAP